MMKKILFCLLFITTIILGANACDCYEDCTLENNHCILYEVYDGDESVVYFEIDYHSFTPKIDNTATYYHCNFELSNIAKKSIDLKVNPTSLSVDELLEVFYIECKDTLLK